MADDVKFAQFNQLDERKNNLINIFCTNLMSSNMFRYFSAAEYLTLKFDYCFL